MRRREFVTLLGGAAAWPLAAHAQQPAMPVIGYLNSASPEGYEHPLSAFRQGLSDFGYVEGQNSAIEFRWAGGQHDRLPELAADLVRRPVNVIVASGLPAALAVKAATTTIPIVFVVSVDPVATGLVTSLNRPGGNITGMSTLSVELGPKRLELLHELVPMVTTIALLINPANPNSETLSREMQAAASTLGLQIHILRTSTESDLERAFATLVQLRIGALVISGYYYRADHPKLDDAEWHVFTSSEYDAKTGEWRMSKLPVHHILQWAM